MAPPYPVIRRRLDRALAARDLEGVRAAARELPGGLSLADALTVLVVMDELGDPRFERAAVRYPVVDRSVLDDAAFRPECHGGSLRTELSGMASLTSSSSSVAST